MLNKRFILFLLCACFFSFACTNRPKEVLSQKKMVALLTDLHKLDGMLNTNFYSVRDTAERYYVAVLEKYHISQVDFDSSLTWYVRNPRRFERVYIDVQENLERWQNEVKAGKFADKYFKKTVSLWELSARQTVNDTLSLKKVNFITSGYHLRYGDLCTLHFLQKVAKTDTLLDTVKMTACIVYADSVCDSVAMFSYSDGLTRRFTVHFPVKHLSSVKSFNCSLAETNVIDKKLKIDFDSIRFTRTFQPAFQDSLLRLVEKADSAYKAKEQKNKKTEGNLPEEQKAEIKKPAIFKINPQK